MTDLLETTPAETILNDQKLMVPTTHLNGTSKQSLLDAISNAVHALHEAGSAVAQTCPNGRDYYPQGDKVIFVALDQHEARMKKLREVIDELEQIGMAID